MNTSSSMTFEKVKEYYGKVLQTNQDLKTNACCSSSMPARLKPIVEAIHPEVLEKFYGCASPIPELLEGKTVLDLGSGSGRDCFICSKLVGPQGKVIGVDMTGSQIDTARKHVEYHTKKFGYRLPNVAFHDGYIEDLESLGIASASVDVVISNCVINLSPNKKRVFSEIFRVLRHGGELYFSDVFADRRVPKELANDPVLLGECLGGALYIEDFRRLLADVGCSDYRVASNSTIAIHDSAILNQLGPIQFTSMTVRAFKLALEDRCEDYGQVAYYKGTIPGHPHTYRLDNHHLFEKNRPLPVCSNTATMLGNTRYAAHFRIEGDLSTHYGLFDCGSPIRNPQNAPSQVGCC